MSVLDIQRIRIECCRISKISNEVGRIDDFEALARKLSFLSTELDIFDIRQHFIRIYLSTSDLLSFIICNTDKYKFSSIWKWISFCNDVMNHVDSVT